jgi:hypothetical protein
MSNPEWDGLGDPDFNDDVGQPKLLWEGSTVEVRARVVPRYFWTTASIDVFLDGRCILQTGGQKRATGESFAEFEHGGRMHTAELFWGVARMELTRGIMFPYQLLIDEAKVVASEVRVENPASMFPPILILASPVLLLLLLTSFF